jgi:ribosomal protein S27AE
MRKSNAKAAAKFISPDRSEKEPEMNEKLNNHVEEPEFEEDEGEGCPRCGAILLDGGGSPSLGAWWCGHCGMNEKKWRKAGKTP